MSPAAEAGPDALSPTDIVGSVPTPVLRLLILFRAPIAALRAALEVLSWKPERRLESWLVVLLWWALCLGSWYAFAWLLPPLLFLPLAPLQRLRLGTRQPVIPTPAQPATTEALLHTIADLNQIYTILPPSPIPPLASVYARFRQLGPWRLVRGLLVLWAVWIGVGHALGTRTLLALAGTVALLLPSPPLAHLVDLLSRSLTVRRVVTLLFLFTFGSPGERDYRLGSPFGWLRSKWAASRRPSTTLGPFGPLPDDEADGLRADRAGNPIYFRFELHENQRWWMGLDWTSALLPQERPSWCDFHLLPVSPPVAFTLPPPASIDLPAPTKIEPRAQVRRTATWRWLDDDWSVVRKTAGPGAPTPAKAPNGAAADDTVAPAAPAAPARPTSGLFSTLSTTTIPEDATTHARNPSIAEQAFAKGLGRLKSVQMPGTSTPTSTVSPVKPAVPRARTGSEASTDASDDTHGAPGAPVPSGAGIPETDDATDADGWVYGDNKWENMGPRGGLGKFTRRRRWQRRAVCVESVHRIPDLAPLPEVIDLDAPPPGSGAATPRGGPTTAKQGKAARSVSGMSTTSSSSTTSALKPPGSDSGVRAPATAAVAPVPAPAQAPSTLIPATQSRDDALRLRLKKAMGSMGA